MIEAFKTFLKRQNLIFTRERSEIVHLVLKFNEVFTADQIVEQLKSMGMPVAPSTVYRNIKLLRTAGLIEVVASSIAEKNCYRKLESRQVSCSVHCLDCDKRYDVENEELNALVLEICGKYNLEPDGIVVSIEGRECHHA